MTPVKAIRNEIKGLVSKSVLQLCNKAMRLPDFEICPASLDKHHSFHGGLAIHTLEAIRIAKQIYKVVPSISFDVVAAALVFHDVGKLFCYERESIDSGQPGLAIVTVPSWSKNQRYYDTYHVVLSYETFKQMSRGMSSEFVQAVGHCILAHHRQREFGSPVTPVTKEAWLVCMSDSGSVTLMTDEYPKKPDTRTYVVGKNGNLRPRLV